MKSYEETREHKEERLRLRKNNLKRLDYKHKKYIKQLTAKDWVGLKAHEKKFYPEEYKLNKIYAEEDKKWKK